MDCQLVLTVFLAASSLCLHGVFGQTGGECVLADGGKGVCRRIRECPPSREIILGGGRPQLCHFDRKAAIVCCPSAGSSSGATASTTQRPTRTTTQGEIRKTTQGEIRKTTQGEIRKTTQGESQKTTRAPWHWGSTSPRTSASKPKRNGKSWQKCREYAKAVFREEQDPVLLFNPEKVLIDECGVNDGQPEDGGVRARPKEFPHMAALGYGDPPKVYWLCGGSLISDKYVLTAASCIYSQDGVRVKWVRFGDLNPSDKSDTTRPQTKRVAKVIVHPRYNRNSLYHDIALIKLRAAVKFDKTVRPACLNALTTTSGTTAVASGWGAPGRRGAGPSRDLMKFGLQVRSSASCNETYKSLVSPRGKLDQGFAEDGMLCLGDPMNARDTCVGYSGDPLQRVLTDPYCMHSVLGVSSFGRQKCGYNDTPAVYTKVSHYLAWIEAIVWG